MANEIEIRVKSKDEATRGFDSVRSSSNRMSQDVRKASLEVETSQVRVEKATQKLTEAQAKYEAGSVQVREAENRLAVEQYKLEQSAGKLARAEREVGSSASVAAHEVDKAGTSAERSKGKFSAFSGLLGTVGRTATMALGGIAIAAAGAGAAGVAMGIKTSASLEQAQISYNTLLGSTQKAQQHLNDLKKFAAATPFELPGLIETDRLLIGAGESADKTLTSLTAWGDASGALGQTQDQFQRTMLAVSQAMGAGKLQAGDLLQITEAGIPIWKLLSEALGKPQSELRKLSEQGQLLTADVLPKLEKQMEKDYGGAMAKQSQTLTGLWSTFMDTLNMGLANAIQPLIPYLKDALPGAMQAVGDGLAWVAKELPVVIKWFQDQSREGGALRKTWDFLSEAVRVYIEYAKNLYGTIWTIVQAALPMLQDALNNVKEAFKNLNSSGVPWMELLKSLAIVLGIVAGVIVGTLIAAFEGLSLIMRDVSIAVKPMWEAFKFATAKILGFLGMIINGAADAFGWIPGIGPKLTAAAKQFNKFADQVNRALGNIQDRQVQVTVTAIGNGVNLVSSSNGIVRYRNSSGISVGAQATGGISHAFEGGVKGNLVEVGEHGRELVRLPFGSMVYSNPDSDRMISGSSRTTSGSNRMATLEVVGNDPALVDLIRRLVRVRGGNVQLAFGSN